MAGDKKKNSEELENIVISSCVDCGRQFDFTVWEQKQFGFKGWLPPKRCPPCRQRRRILNKSLRDGVSISDQGVHEAECAKCGIKFFSILTIRANEKEYCPDCWKEIKGF